MIYHSGIWNWKYLRKTMPIAQGYFFPKFYFDIIYMNIYLIFFFELKLFPFDVGDLAYSLFITSNLQHEKVAKALSMFKDEPPDAFLMLRSNYNFQQASMIQTRGKRKDELVINNALIQEEPPDPTPLIHAKNPIQVSNSLTQFVSHASRTVIMHLMHPENIEKKLSLFKEFLERNFCLRMHVKEEHEKDNALIQPETYLSVFDDSMTMITHLFFAKGVDDIAGTKEEPPDLEFLPFSFFERTGIGVTSMHAQKLIAYFRRIFEVGEQLMVQLRKKQFPAERREEDKRFKPPDLNQDKHQDINSFMQIKEAPPDAACQPISSIFEGKILIFPDHISDYVSFIADELDLRSNPFQEGEDDMIMASTKDMELEPDGNKLEGEEQLEPDKELIAEKECGRHVILTSLVLIHDHQMGMCLICTLFPLSSFVPLGFLDKVFNEANVSHSNHPFDDPNRGIIFRIRPKGIKIKFSPFYAHYKSKKSPKQVTNFLAKGSYESSSSRVIFKLSN